MMKTTTTIMTLSRDSLALYQPRNFHLYWPVANHIGPLLGLYQPFRKQCIRADI